ncbi:Disco-interacting protein 2 -like protein C [Trichinella nelsoni]|uniref:Disco-interacting protein 2-like protein C n=1 Tax=Trichinella nelsoni TaxID=6336 RepID=A0A0V0S3R1_9BILA|nr:Disco-interacting protein 2 -like protein C [Trichinella nelsoni]
MASVDYSLLPREAREQLAQLDLELSEGDLTRKGYEKKKNNLLSQFDLSATPGKASPTTRAQRRRHRRVTRDESRFHSEIRIEAVQQALARYAQREQKGPSVPVPVKRVSQAQRNLLTKNTPLSDSSSEDDSLVSSGGDSVNLKATPNSIFHVPAFGPTAGDKVTSSLLNDFAKGLAFSSENGSSRPPPPDVTTDAQAALLVKNNADRQEDHQQSSVRVANASNKNRLSTVSILDKTDGQADYQNADLGIKSSKVSQKIQLLLSTLQKPKKKPLHEYYNDDDVELEAMAKMIDPSAPKPEGAIIYPATGESVRVAPTFPRSLTSALQRYGVSNAKSLVGTVLDHAGRAAGTLTYGKLLSRSTKLAYLLSNKMINKVEPLLKPGDRVALVYPNNDPLGFMVAFYGCLLARIIPVLIEVPISKRDGGIQQVGFLLGSCSVQVALTSESCYKGLPKSPNGDVIDFKAWPKLTWLITDHLSKAPKDWFPTLMCDDERIAYIEYTTDKEGSVKGVSVSFASLTAHSKALTAACQYKEGETMVCVLDFKREVGLWHAIQTSVFNAMHVIFVPYSLMKVNPAVWLQMITKCKASIALAKSRDLHWGLLAARDCKDVNLSSLRILLVADGSNPWSLTSCDQFVNVFKSRGLQNNVLCPCASSSETLTVAIRRGGQTNSNSIRGTLSMSALSFGVVRVDQDSSLTSLTLQDSGQVLPGAIVAVVKLNGSPYLCKADEIGEICVLAHSTTMCYWGLEGLSYQIFNVEPLGADDRPISVMPYVRSGLIGFLAPGGLVFVCGIKNGLMCVSGRYHNVDDIIATVLAVEPMKFVYRGRIAVFSVKVLRDERICIIAEQRAGVYEEDSFQWMSRVLQAIDTIHMVGVYCLALVPPNGLTKTPLGGIHVSETRQKFLDGTLNFSNLLMCPHTCVTNLPKPREPQPDVGPAAVFVGNIVQGARIAVAQGRDLGPVDEDQHQYLHEILRTRALQSPDHVLFTLINSKGAEVTSLTCANLMRRADRIGCLLLEKGRLNVGDHVALIFAPGIELICAFYGCLSISEEEEDDDDDNDNVEAVQNKNGSRMVPVCIRPPHPQNLQSTLPTVKMVVDVSRSVAILSTASIIKLLRSKEANSRVDAKAWPTILDAEEPCRRKHVDQYRPHSPNSTCYLDFSVSTTGMLAGIKMSHLGISAQCRSLKMACELYPSRHVCLCLDPYCVRDTFCSYGVVELCVRDLASQVTQLKERGVQLSCVRTCVIVAEERPRVQLCAAFAKLFSSLGLPQRAVSTNPSTVYVDMKALRNDRVTLVEKGSPHSLPVMESGKLLPGVKVVIANPDTCGQLADSHLGEIWVQSMHNASGYFTIHGEESSIHNSHFNAHLSTGDTLSNFARTGYVGFLRRTQAVTADGGKSNILTMRFLLLVLWTKR